MGGARPVGVSRTACLRRRLILQTAAATPGGGAASEASALMSTYTFPVALEYPMPGGPGVNVWHLRTTGDEVPSTSDLESLSEIIQDFYQACSSIFPDSYRAKYLGEATTIGASPQVDQSAPAWTVNGSAGSGGYLPVAAQMCLVMRTDSATRSGRGRKFLGPLASNGLEADGTPSNGTLSTIQTAATALVSSSEGFGNGAIGVYSPTTSTFRDLLGFTVANQYAVLRSRRN